MPPTLAFSEIEIPKASSLKSRLKQPTCPEIPSAPPPFNNNAEDNEQALNSDFVAPPPPLSAKALHIDSKSALKAECTVPIIENMQDRSVSQSTYEKINSTDANYKQYIPPYNSPSTQDTELSKKINYMIHILEEQQDMKHGSVTEELVLYCFLGVFIIYVVDSFAKVGKYVR